MGYRTFDEFPPEIRKAIRECEHEPPDDYKVWNWMMDFGIFGAIQRIERCSKDPKVQPAYERVIDQGRAWFGPPWVD